MKKLFHTNQTCIIMDLKNIVVSNKVWKLMKVNETDKQMVSNGIKNQIEILNIGGG